MSKAQTIPSTMNDMYVNIKTMTEKSATEDEVTVRITVGEVENGFIVTKSISGQRSAPTNENPDYKEWFDEGKSYITTKNPLEATEDEDVKLPDIKGLIDSFNSGKLGVS